MANLTPFPAEQEITTPASTSKAIAALVFDKTEWIRRSRTTGNSGWLAGDDKNPDVFATGSVPLDRQDLQTLLRNCRLKATRVET